MHFFIKKNFQKFSGLVPSLYPIPYPSVENAIIMQNLSTNILTLWYAIKKWSICTSKLLTN